MVEFLLLRIQQLDEILKTPARNEDKEIKAERSSYIEIIVETFSAIEQVRVAHRDKAALNVNKYANFTNYVIHYL